MSAFSSVNTGLYVALADQFGTKDDVVAGAMIALTCGAFFAFALGASMNFQNIINAGILGVILGVSVVLITGFAGYFVHSLLGYKAGVTAAIGNTAGNQLATPLAVVAADATLAPFLGVATAQIATSIIVTCILCPLLVGYLDKKLKAKKARATHSAFSLESETVA